MNKRDSGAQWFGIPVFIVDVGIGRVDIITNDREDLENPVFIVDEPMFNDIQNNFEKHRLMLDYLVRQFKRGKIEPLNEAAREADKKRGLS